MNLYDYFKKNVQLDKVKDFSDDMYEIALVRYVMKEASKIFYRDYTFFLNKENILARDKIYNKKENLSDIQDFSIVCKSYCDIIQDVLKKLYGVETKIISAFDDKFRHVDLLVETKAGKKYIVDPLTDLVEMQTNLKTNNFASRKYYETLYSNIYRDIVFLSDEELRRIDDKIGYTEKGQYLNDSVNELRKNFDDFENFLIKNKSVAEKLLGTDYDGKKFTSDEKLELKLRYISKFLNNRSKINGFVEFVIFSNIMVKELFSEEEQKKIKISNFFVDEKDLKTKEVASVLKSPNARKRGRVISFNGKNYIFSLNQNTLEFSDEEWENIVEENNVFVKKEYEVQLLKYLKENGADRNIVHNNEFLRLFNKFENALLNQGKSLDDIKRENILIGKDIIFTKVEENYISYKIENGKLVVKDYSGNKKYIITYDDEGRNIVYNAEPILKENEMLKLYEFDSNGIFDLEDASGIESLVVRMKNGKLLSRNASFYEAKTYTELSKQRKELKEVLTEDFSKKNFVILEYLANASAKVYFEELKKQIEHKENRAIDAKKCFEEDCRNIVRFFEKRPLLEIEHELPEGEDRILERHIEMDNKQMLYLFCSSLKTEKQMHVITPGLGSIFVGPMLKSMYGFEYSNILFSLYSKDEKLRNISESKSFENLFSDDCWKKTNSELLLIDDNVGSCSTMNTIRNNLHERGKNCKFGAIKYNWEFYYQVKNGELQHPTFDIKEVDMLTVIDDPGYWIMRDSINALKNEGGDAYVEVMQESGLRKKEIPDIMCLMQLTNKHTKKAGVDLFDLESGKIKKSSAILCRRLKEKIEEITKENKKDMERE